LHGSLELHTPTLLIDIGQGSSLGIQAGKARSENFGSTTAENDADVVVPMGSSFTELSTECVRWRPPFQAKGITQQITKPPARPVELGF
jgi:hypothetical protein